LSHGVRTKWMRGSSPSFLVLEGRDVGVVVGDVCSLKRLSKLENHHEAYSPRPLRPRSGAPVRYPLRCWTGVPIGLGSGTMAQRQDFAQSRLSGLSEVQTVTEVQCRQVRRPIGFSTGQPVKLVGPP
jgi:hypothetical protein